MVTEEEAITKVTRHGQVTLPASVRREARVEEGDLLSVRLEGENIVLTPKRLIDKSQAYFWTEGWQQAEREAEKDIAEGRVTAFESVDDLIAALDQAEG
jgi:AbrB family looped-hinge helix DNA binding protein